MCKIDAKQENRTRFKISESWKKTFFLKQKNFVEFAEVVYFVVEFNFYNYFFICNGLY